MSAIDAFATAYNTVLSLNSGFGMLQNNHKMNRNVAAASNPNLSFGAMEALHNNEKALVASNLKNSLMYKMANTQLEALEAKDKKKRKLDVTV